jgi:signal transduction histidine kinase
MIERQVRRMTQLPDDLLDVSRITHGRLYLQRERLDLRGVAGLGQGSEFTVRLPRDLK